MKRNLFKYFLFAVMFFTSITLISFSVNAQNEGFDYKVPNVYNPETGIINPATVVQTVESIDDYNNSLLDVRPATLIFNVNGVLEIVNTKGTKPSTVDNVLNEINGLIIPAFKTNNKDVAILLVNKLKSLGVIDFFLVSNDAEVILEARRVYHFTRGILEFDYNEDKPILNKEDLISIRDQASKAQATVALIPFEYINLENVKYLQMRLITVWTKTDNTASKNYEAILAGVNGIVTSDFNKVFNIYKEFPKNSIVRKSLTIAHRGLSTYDETLKNKPVDSINEPENSPLATKLAIERGAEIIEIDVHITKDDKLVVYHDFTTGRLYNKDLNVNESTLSELQALTYKFEKFADTKIETFYDFMNHFKDEEVVFFIEIKSWVKHDLLIKGVNEVLNDLNMKDRVVIISFDGKQLAKSLEVMPELSVGFLDYSGLYKPNTEDTVKEVLNFIMPYPTTINHSVGGLTKENVVALTHRGVTVWPWTINGPELDRFFMMGTGGNTTDTINYYKDTWFGFDLVQKNYEYNITENNLVHFNSKQTTIASDELEMAPDTVLVDCGGTGIVIERNRVIKADRPGVAKVMASMPITLPNGTQVILYENIITINVIDTDIIETNSPNVLKYVLLGFFGLAAITTIVVLLTKKRK